MAGGNIKLINLDEINEIRNQLEYLEYLVWYATPNKLDAQEVLDELYNKLDNLENR